MPCPQSGGVLVSLLPPSLAASVAPGPIAARAAEVAPADVASALALAGEFGRAGAAPGLGGTRDLWEALTTVAATDLGAARAMEPHLDAVAILMQAGIAPPHETDDTWGVFAAEGGDDPLEAEPATDGTWRLTGTKPWCSLADRLDAALVTASVGDARGLFAVQLRHEGVTVIEGAWAARGLIEVPSGPVRFAGVPAIAIGDAGWYLTRPGFAWGGIGVAACWFGGAVGIARTVFAAAAARGDSLDPIVAHHLGAIDESLAAARAVLAEAAGLVDAGAVDAIEAARVRGVVATSCEQILIRAGHALGPAPLALDAAHAKRVADLQLYLRQHHAERDQRSLGDALAAGALPW